MGLSVFQRRFVSRASGVHPAYAITWRFYEIGLDQIKPYLRSFDEDFH